MEAELVPLLALFQDLHLALARGAFPVGVLLVSDKVLKGERRFHNTEISLLYSQPNRQNTAQGFGLCFA